MLRPRQVFVTEVGRELGQKIVHIGAGAIPGDDAVNGCGVPQIVHTGLISRIAFPREASNLAQALECRADC